MRILHVVNTLNPAGAGPVEAARLYALMSSPACSIEVLSLDDDVRPWSRDWPVPVHSAGRAYSSYRYSPSLVTWLRERASSFDGVVVHGVWHYHLPAVWLALRSGSIPYFVVLHGMLNPWFKRTYPIKHFKKWVFWRGLVRSSIADAAAVLFLCEEESRLARQTFDLKVGGEAFVPLGVRAEPSSPDLFLDKFPHLRSKRLLLFLGRICFMKGCDLLLDAFAGVAANYPDAQLVMCGPDHEQWQPELMQRAQQLGIGERVTWAGPVYGEMKWSALNAADLFVFPSRCETFPIAMLEALSCGVPVLVTEDVNIWRTVFDAGAGLVCRPAANSVRQAMAGWLASSPSETQAYRERARQCFMRNYEVHTAFRKHMDALEAHMPSNSAPLLAERS